MKRILLIFSILLNLVLLVWVLSQKSCSLIPPDQPMTTHNLVVEKVSALGKMELVKYNFQDIVSHEVIKEYWPFDPKVILTVKGEAVGCVDFAQVDSSMITQTADTLYLRLPAAEICFSRILHDESRVYDTRFTFFEETDMVDEAYKKAEKAILDAAVRGHIIEQTEDQARESLAAMLSQIANKPVVVSFPERPLIPQRFE